MKSWCMVGAAMVLTGCAGMNDEGAPSATASGSPAAATAPATPVSTGVFVTEAAQSDMFEIQAGQLAAERAASPAVKAFAQQMVTDHTASLKALTSALVTADVPASPPTSLDPRREAMIRQLEGVSGAAFDRLYLQQMKAAHQEALTLHTNYARDGDNTTLQALAGQVAGKVQQHIDQLQQIAPA